MFDLRPLLLGVLLSALATGCETVGKPQARGENASAPAPSAVKPGGCKALCQRHGACLSTFRKLGGRPQLLAAEDLSCAQACDQTARDPLVGKLLDRVIRTCGQRAGCDDFYGCAVRTWLTHLAKHPWKRLVLRAQRARRQVNRTVRMGTVQQALRLCGDPKLFADLKGLKQPQAKAARSGLATACGGAVKARLEHLVTSLEVLVSKLEPDAHNAPCREARTWRAPDWLPSAHPARKRAQRAGVLCDQLDGQRKLAYAIQYAERDTATVQAALKAGRADDAAYYKCVHKGKSLKTLQAATHPRALAAAKALRQVCFEQFTQAFLKRHRAAKARFESRHCYKVRKAAGLLSRYGSRPVVTAAQPLLQWAESTCRAP